MTDTLKLSDVPMGRRVRICAVAARGGIRRRLLDMGLVPGTELRIERVAPLGDPIAVNVRGYRLSLRKEEAACIEVESL